MQTRGHEWLCVQLHLAPLTLVTLTCFLREMCCLGFKFSHFGLCFNML